MMVYEQGSACHPMWEAQWGKEGAGGQGQELVTHIEGLTE
jgi:hypothetical protein